MTEATETVRKNDWIRFQIQDRRVLEGFVQAISEDGSRLLIGKAPDWPENQWHNLADIKVLGHQTINSPI